MVLLGMTLNFVRRYEEAITLFKEANRRNPYGPAWYIPHMGVSYAGLGKWDEAIAEFKRALQRKPDHFPALQGLAWAYAGAGRLEEGRAVAAEILKVNPGYCIERMSIPYKYKADAESKRENYRKVGIPDKPSLPLPDKPSIAVLPFTNMSDDPKQEFFSDGLAEEIINALSTLPQVFVIARNSSFTYKGKNVDVKQVGRELGVKYVLEGSVRREGDRVRITAQLIDATVGNHIFSERYDRELKDIFALQDEITMKVLNATQVKLMGLGTDQAKKAEKLLKGKQGLDCWLKYLEGVEYAQRSSIEANKEIRRIAEEVMSMCPENP
jgi:TolB-like protein